MSNYLREIRAARVDAQRLNIELADGCAFSVPLSFYPSLLLATDEERQAMEVNPYSLHWDALDCDLGIEGLLQGVREHPRLADKAWQRFKERQNPVAA